MVLMMSPRSPSWRSTGSALGDTIPMSFNLRAPLDQEGSIPTKRIAHVLVGVQVGKLPPLLLGDQHPVEPGEAISTHFSES